MRLRSLFLLFSVLVSALSAHAQDARLEANTDLNKARALADLVPLSGAVLKGYHYWPTQTVRVLLGPVAGTQAPRQKTIVGSRTLLFYNQPDAPDQQAIMRQYEGQFQAAGGGVAFQCDGAACAPAGTSDGAACAGTLGWFYAGEKDPINDRIQSANGANISDWADIMAAAEQKQAASLPTECHLAVGFIPAASSRQDRYVSVFAMNVPSFSPPLIDILVEVTEASPFAARTVAVTADVMANDIHTTGHVALYGLYFDFDKSELKPDSGTTLAEIVALLHADPGLRLLVVGHTDNQGGYDYNMTLSRKRAEAVVAALTRGNQIEAAKLRPAGDGMTAPVASNETEAGRALNRRVELVRQ